MYPGKLSISHTPAEQRSSPATGVPGVLPLPDEPHHDAVHQPGVDQDRTCQSAHPWLRQLAAKSGGRLFDLPLRGDVPHGRHCLPASGRNQRTRVGVSGSLSSAL